MTKEEIIAYWQKSAQLDWERVESMYANNDIVGALFFVHLSLEKILKAHWVKNNSHNIPPKTHNLSILYSQTDLDLETTDVLFLENTNSFNLETRYPDYKFSLYKFYTKENTKEIFIQAKNVLQCLQEKLQ